MPSGSPVLLAIETSQRAGGVAVRDREGRDHVELLSAGRYDEQLMPAIDRLYGRLGLRPADTGAVGVSVGPGGFTGLRIAVTTAMMLAETAGASIVSIPSALVAASSYEGPGPIVVALAAKGSTCWAARLDRTGDGMWGIASEGRLADAASIDLTGVKAVLADSYLPQALREKCEQLGRKVVAPNFDSLACLAILTHLYMEDRTTDPLVLTPMYPRPPEAVVRWEARNPVR